MTGATGGTGTGAGAGGASGATYGPGASSGCTTGSGKVCSIRSSGSSSGGGGGTLIPNSTASCTNSKYLGSSGVAGSSGCRSWTSRTC